MRYVLPKWICFCVLLALTLVLPAQERKLGTWKMYLPYNRTTAVCDAGDRVYSACEKSVFSYEKSSGTIQTYDKSTGLSDVGITTIAYDPTTKYLVIIYNNSNIDLIYNGTDIYNIPDIKNKATTSAVVIYGVSFYNGTAFISSAQGISTVDLDRKEIKNTYSIGSNGAPVTVYASSTDGTTIYAATAEGVKHAPYAAPNLQDYNVWSTYDSSNGIPAKKASYIATYNGKAYAVIKGSSTIGDTLYELNGNQWTPISLPGTDGNTFTSLGVANGSLYFSTWLQNSFAGTLGKISFAGVAVHQSQNHSRPNNWLESDGISWESDPSNGLFKNNNQGYIENIVPDGPFSSSVFSLNASDGAVYVAAGGVDDSWINSNSGDGFFVYKNGRWANYNVFTNGNLGGYNDIVCVAYSAATGNAYLGSFFRGLIEFNSAANTVNTYDSTNSILEQVLGDPQRVKVSAVASDQHGNLWMGNAGATNPIKVIKTDHTWKGFTVPFNFQLIKKMIVDQNDQLWMPLRSSPPGMLVWSYGQTLDDRSDDASRLLTAGTGLGNLPDGVVNCVAEDKDGNIWAGTNAGIGIFYCPGSVLTSNGCDADQIKVTRDGYVGYLFGTESVRAIAIDAANRKWIGTTNGVWLISADGKTELLKFNIDNSPMPANQVTDIAINDQTGEVFIGTSGGLLSYQSDAMETCEDCNDKALVYPNPVKPDYSGPIAIKGLTDNAYVKITDAAGKLVFQGKANGSQMIWDGKGYTGSRAKSGVYLVFSSTDLGKERRVAKILITN